MPFATMERCITRLCFRVWGFPDAAFRGILRRPPFISGIRRFFPGARKQNWIIGASLFMPLKMFKTPRALFEPLESRRLLSAVSLDFNGGAGGLANSGFAAVLPSTRGGSFVSSHVGVSGGLLRVTSTAGDLLTSKNNQDDALATALDSSTNFTVQTRIVNFPFKKNGQSAGIFIAADQDNYVKLVAGKNGLQLGSEIGGAFTLAPGLATLSFGGVSSLDLRIVGTASTHTLTAQYRINSSSDSAWVTFGTTRNTAVFSSAAKAGSITTNSRSRKSVTVGFDSFSAQSAAPAPVAPSPAPTPTPAVTAALSAGSNVNATRLTQSQASPQIVINPANPQNLVMVSQTAENQAAIPVSYSFNGGATWTLNYITGATDGLPGSNPRVDPRATFDKFGNLYVSYEVAANSNEIRVVVARSSNGGVSFNAISTAVGGAGSDLDYPTIAAGPDATNPNRQAIWISYTDYAKPNNLQIKAVVATSTGLGQLSGFSAPMLVSRTSQGDLASIAVGASGQVAVAYEADDNAKGPERVFVATNGRGLAGSFASNLAATSNVGYADPVPAEPNRTLFADAQVAFDRSGGVTNGRLYLVYTDATKAGGADTNIALRYTDNLGASFSSAVKVNDDTTTRSQFLPALAVDPATGNVGVAWLDARNSANNNTVQEYATVSNTHGATFQSNIRISAGTSNPSGAADADTVDFGDITGAAFFNNKLILAWADNSNSTANNPNGSGSFFDVYVDTVTVNPTAFVKK